MTSINNKNNGDAKNRGEKNRIDWNSIEEKWRDRWEEQMIFQADPDVASKKYCITVA